MDGVETGHGSIRESCGTICRLILLTFLIVASVSGQWVTCAGTATDTCTEQSAGIGTLSPGGVLEVSTSSTTAKPLIIRGSSAPGADLLTLYGYVGGTVFKVTSYGGALFKDAVAIGAGPTSDQELMIHNGSGPTRMGLVVKGTTAQTGDLQQWQDSSGSPLTVVTSDGHVGIGTPTPQSALSVNGTVSAKEVVVTATGWPDYVLDPEHAVMPLSALAAYLRKNRHLPDIPSAEEVAARGVSLGEMQAKLLAKIEELTLEMIRLDSRNRELSRQIEKLRKGSEK
jgi:hypothetical protein